MLLKSTLVLITCSLITSLSIAADSAATSTSSDLGPTVLLDRFTVTTDPVERVKFYGTRAEDVWKGMEERKTIRYLDVLCATYSQFDIAKVLLAKKRYRETVAKGSDFYCNYAAVNVEVPVVLERPKSEFASMSGIKGGNRYDFKKKRISIFADLDRCGLFHIAGMSLAGSPSPESLAKIKQLARDRADSKFAKQVKFEGQLQDLNRFYVTVTGKLILKPIDALRAIVLLGEKPPRDLLIDIYRRNNLVIDTNELDAALALLPASIEQASDQGTGTFGFADRLVHGLEVEQSHYEMSSDVASGMDASLLSTSKSHAESGLQQLKGSAYSSLLEAILIQAPGHF